MENGEVPKYLVSKIIKMKKWHQGKGFRFHSIGNEIQKVVSLC